MNATRTQRGIKVASLLWETIVFHVEVSYFFDKDDDDDDDDDDLVDGLFDKRIVTEIAFWEVFFSFTCGRLISALA